MTSPFFDHCSNGGGDIEGRDYESGDSDVVILMATAMIVAVVKVTVLRTMMRNLIPMYN